MPLTAKGKKVLKRLIDNKMKHFGETDFDKKTIKVNPKKGDLINTILHEELHAKHPKAKEKTVRKKASSEEKKMTIKKAIKLLNKFK